MRRANGTGSVYKRPDNAHRHRPWAAVVNLGFSEKGKRKKKIIGSFRTQREAQRAMDMYNTAPPTEEKKKITWGQVWEAVKNERERQNRKISRVVMSMWKNHVSKLKDIDVSETKAIHLQEIVDSSGLAGQSQIPIKTAINLLYEYAMKNELVDKDYATFVKTAQAEKSAIHKPFTTEEMRTLWKDKDIPVAQIILIQCYTGMRPNELAKMRIENVDLPHSVMVGGAKTEAGKNRSIPIADCIKGFVEHFYNISKFKRSPLLITPDVAMEIYSTNREMAAYQTFKKYFRKVGMDHRPHDGRHTFVTLSDNYGMPEAIQKKIVGHVSSHNNVTKEVYTHKVFPQLLEAVNNLPFGEQMTMYPEEIGSQLEATR